MAKLDEDQISDRLAGLEGWRREGSEIRREYRLDSFDASIRFVNEVAELAESMDHHPDIDIRFDRVRLALSTHSAGGLTARDFDLARRIDEQHARSSGI